MFLPNHKTTIELIHEKEIETFKQEYIEANGTQVVTDPFVDGNVLFKVPYNRSSMQTLIDKGARFPVKDIDNATFHNDYSSIFKDVTSQILDIKLKGSFRECIDYIANLRRKAGNNLYGVLLRQVGAKSVIINPLHPLTALSVLNDRAYLKEAKFNLIAYFYPNRKSTDKKLNTHQGDPEKIKQSIDSLIQLFTSRLSTEIRVDAIKEHYNNQYEVTYRTKIHPDEVRNTRHYIVAHQLVTKGIICPYYGTSLITLPNNGQSTGTPLSPLTSANISSSGNTAGSQGSVCCGSQNNKTLEGLRTLTHSNLSSPYCSRNFLDGSLMYIDACINKVFEIYHKVGLIESTDGLVIPIEAAPVSQFSDEELACTSIAEFHALHKGLSLGETIELYKQLKEAQSNGN